MAEYPTGTVTFLFTDIVESSRLWDEYHDDMERAMVRHDALATKTMASFAGVVIKHTGDGLFTVFSSAFNAIDAALALQDALGRESSGAVTLAVRIGLHTGEAEYRDGDYFGADVSRAARVMSTAKAGNVHVSQATREVVRDRLPAGWELGDLGEVELRGFSRSERVFRLVSEGDDTARHSTERPAGATSHDRAAWIAVLPFENLSRNPDKEYFADGITEDLITRLGAFRSLRVIARTSSFNYRHSDLSLPRIADELGVSFVLTGTVRRSGDRIRVSVQLIAADQQRQLWSNRYDAKIDDIFDTQDQITDSIVAAIDPAIRATAIEHSAGLRPGSLDAWDHVQRGWAEYYLANPEANAKALAHFEAAIDLDPNYSLAFAAASLAHLFDGWLLWVEDPARSLEVALTMAKTAVGLDQRDAQAHVSLAIANFGLQRLEASIRSAEKAVVLNPSLPGGHIFAGVSRVHGNDPAAGIEMITRGIKLDPHDPLLNWSLGVRAIGHFLLHDNDRAISDARAAIAVRYGYLMGRIVLVAALADSGQTDAARSEFKDLYSIYPDFKASMLDQYVFSDEDRARLIDGLRQAGLET